MSKKSAKTNSLNEKLSSLIQTRPQVFESDDEDFTTVNQLKSLGDESDYSADELAVTKFRTVNKKLLAEDDNKYIGKTVTRKNLGSDTDSRESDGSDSSSGTDIGNELCDVEYHSEDENCENEEDEQVPDEELGCDSYKPASKKSDTNLRDLKSEGTDDVDLNKSLFRRAAKDVEKGKAVKNQLMLWDSLLDYRMKFQPCLVASNQLPNFKSYPKFKANDEFITSVAETKKSLKKLLKSLLSLQEVFLSSNEDFINLVKSADKEKQKNVTDDGGDDNEEILSDFENDSANDLHNKTVNLKKFKLLSSHFKKLNDFSNEITKRHMIFQCYRNSTIQKWDDKTRLGYISSKNFSAFEQSTLKQIEQILIDKQRLITRTQTKRSSYSILGSNKNDEPPKKLAKGDGEDDSELIYSQKTKPAIQKEIFDDDDFYHQLLSELIKRRASDMTDPVQLGRQWMQLQKIRSKMKKTVDTKASKARKVRFVVHPKLVNFMMPSFDSLENENARQELINSLFGKKK